MGIDDDIRSHCGIHIPSYCLSKIEKISTVLLTLGATDSHILIDGPSDTKEANKFAKTI
jgi:hypothetical protein